MIRSIVFIVIMTTSWSLNAQQSRLSIPLKIDNKDIFRLNSDSISYSFYGITDAEKVDTFIAEIKGGMHHIESKEMVIYSNDTLDRIVQYEYIDGRLELGGTTTFKIKDSTITRENKLDLYGIVMSYADTFSYDYIWLTKIIGTELVSLETASKVIFDPEAQHQYKNEVLKITSGNITSTLDKQNGITTKSYFDIDGKKVREETIFVKGRNLHINSKTMLKTDKEDHLIFNTRMDIVQRNNITYQYLPDHEHWEFLIVKGKIRNDQIGIYKRQIFN